jgi:hypothetical protein
MISTNESANQILLNDKTNLLQASSFGQLYNATSGWYLDRNTDSLFVKYQSTGVDTLRFVFYAPSVIPSVVFPRQIVITIFEAVIAVEVVTLALLALRGRRQGPKTQNKDDPQKM